MTLGYSPLSAIDRQITACPQYDKFFAKPKNNKLVKKLVDSDGGVEETVKQMIAIVNRNYKEVNKAKHLVKGSTTYQTAKNIFDFLYKHIKYNLERGEILNSPAASYYFGQVKARLNPDDTDNWPVDCDDFSIFAASLLKSLGLPWAFRIASYDGNNYSHVYCVVPGKQEIIIDPVYFAFNQEKPYKKQKTYQGTKSNNNGMEIYTQGITGLSGIGNTVTESKMIELAGGSHFAGVGLGSAEDDFIVSDIALRGYLADTLYVAKNNPNSVAETYKNPQEFIGMLGRAISALNSKDEEDILNELARQENRMMAKGSHSLRGLGIADEDFYLDEDYTGEEPEELGLEYHYQDGERYFASLQGFFGSLGLFRRLRKKIRSRRIKRLKRKNPAKLKKIRKRWGKRSLKRAKRKVRRKKFFKNAAKFFNKLNPVTVAARNGLRALIALNFVGIASKLKNDKNAHKKVVALFEKMGGKGSKIVKTIDKASKRKPLFKKNAKVSVSGLEGFGAVVAIAGILKVAGGILKKILGWFKDRKAKKERENAIQPENEIQPIAPPEDDWSEGEEDYEDEEYNVIENEQPEKQIGSRVFDFVKDNFLKPQSANAPDAAVKVPSVNRGDGYPVSQTRSFEPKPVIPTGTIDYKKYGIIAGAVLGGVGLVYLINQSVTKASTVKATKPLQGIELK